MLSQPQDNFILESPVDLISEKRDTITDAVKSFPVKTCVQCVATIKDILYATVVECFLRKNC